MKEIDIKRGLIRKLFYLGKWGRSHTSFDNLPKGFPKELRKGVKTVAKDLIKKGLLLSKPTSYGIQVSLNPTKKPEIENILGI